uniref:Rap guanine nucleotide exchange factor (GEF) 5a n=1 Tax=Sparus aurata TaxID=8175 RepID=A0A671TVB3_SPAAU
MVVVAEISVVLMRSSHFFSFLLSIFILVNCYFRPILPIQYFQLFTNNILIIFFVYQANKYVIIKMLLDDFLLTYLVFMSTSDLCQALSARCRGQEEGKDALFRKRKVLQLVSHWSRLYKDFLKEEEHVRSFMKTLYRCVLEDLYEFPTLEKDLKEFQKLLRRRHFKHHNDSSSALCQSKPVHQQLSLKENCLQPRSPATETRDVICCVYVSTDSYLSVHTHPSMEAHELLRIVGQKMDRAEDDTVLAVVSQTGERRVLQPSDCVYSESLTPQGKLLACRRDLTEILPPLTDSAELSRRPVRLLGINTWDVAAALTHLDWSLFKSIHEQELVYYTLSRAPGTGHTAALSVLLQRCNEVQQWVMSEVLMCVSLNKRVQLLKKFIKIAAHCKAQRNLNSAFAIIMGLNTAAVSRLNQTWEVRERVCVCDPSLNHKAYREFLVNEPEHTLLLLDITFIHEGNKTFHDNLVNFEKLVSCRQPALPTEPQLLHHTSVSLSLIRAAGCHRKEILSFMWRRRRRRDGPVLVRTETLQTAAEVCLNTLVSLRKPRIHWCMCHLET